MAGSLNKIMLIGQLGKDPEQRNFANGGSVVNFSVACSESWKDRTTGEKKEKTEWVPIQIFNEQLGKVAMDYLKKGSKVYIEGKFATRKWSKDGIDHYQTECVLQGFDGKLVMLSKNETGSGSGRDQGHSGSSYGGAASNGRSDSSMGAGGGYDDLDDIPF